MLQNWDTRKWNLWRILLLWDFPGGSVVKNTPAMQETWVQSLSQEDPLEKEMATHSSILAWRIPWTEEPGELQSTGSQRVGHDLETNQRQLLLWVFTQTDSTVPKDICLEWKTWGVAKVSDPHHARALSPTCAWPGNIHLCHKRNRRNTCVTEHRSPQRNCRAPGERSHDWGSVKGKTLKVFKAKHLATAAAAKSLQSCPTLWDPIDGSPPGSPIPGIPRARTLEWVAISFSNAWKWKVKRKSLSHFQLFATPWTAAYQAPLSMGFSRQEYWSGVPSPSPKHLATGHTKQNLTILFIFFFLLILFQTVNCHSLGLSIPRCFIKMTIVLL